MVGLGGGSLAKYCYHKLPDTRISVAEINPNVIALREHFRIPNDDDRLRISCEDGATFVRRQAGVFDVLLVDGFDNAGQPPQLCSQQFYNHCYRSLTPTGVLVVNLLGNEHPISRIRRSFSGQVVVAGGDNSTSNLVAFASRETPSLSRDLSSVCIPGKDFEVPVVHRKSVRPRGMPHQIRPIPGKALA
jgi:spermidine synthase